MKEKTATAESAVKPAGAESETSSDTPGEAGKSTLADSASAKPSTGGTVRQASYHDRATLEFIENELQDATPEEREQWFLDLKGLEPAMVRNTLRIRRLAIQMGQRRSPDASLAQAAAQHPATAQPGLQQNGAASRSGDLNPHDGAPGNSQFAAAATPGMADPAQAATPMGLGAAFPHRTVQAPAPRPQATDAAWNQETAPFQQFNPLASAPQTQFAASGQTQFGSAAPAPVNNGGPAGAAGFGHAGNFPSNASPAGFTGGNPVQLGPNGIAAIDSAAAFAPGSQLPTGHQASPGGPVSSGIPVHLGAVPHQNQIPGLQTPPPVSSGMGPRRIAPQLADQAQPIGINPLEQASAAGPAPKAGSSMWGSDLEKMIALAAAETAQLSPGKTPAEQQEYLTKHVDLRLLYLIAGQQQRALEAIPGLPPADQEFWQQMFWGMANYFDFETMPNGADRATQTVGQLRRAIQRLQENANLELRNVNFCHKIASFGHYERFPRDEFNRGQPVLLYAEVGNFKSEPTADGQFRTILQSTIDLLGPGGGVVEQVKFPATEDLCRNYRRDYFHSYEFTVPQGIPLGPHVLKLTVEDQLSHKVATYTLNFTVK